MTDFDAMRLNMVESQIRPNKVVDPRLISAFSSLPRERFVPDELSGVAYVDEDLQVAPGRYLTEPAVMAQMIQAARIAETDTVLDVGCGTGYSTAVIAQLAGTAIGLESDEAMSERASGLLTDLGIDNAMVVSGALPAGHAGQGPYDVIMVNGAVLEIPEALLGQLAEDGRLVTVLQNRQLSDRSHAGQATMFLRTAGGVAQRSLFDAAVPALPGFEAEAGFVF